MKDLPLEVIEYLESYQDSLTSKELLQRHPGLAELLNDAAVRQSILDWLASDEAWQESASGLTMNCLEHLRERAIDQEAPAIRGFLLHSNPYVRLRAYELLLTLYFPDVNQEAMFLLLHGMLADEHDAVRSQAARYIERADAADELGEFLHSWLRMARARRWEESESFELVEGLMQD